MNHIVAGFGVLLALAVMGVSAVCNARYSMTLAKEGTDQYVMMVASLFADGGKALSWILFAGALGRREFLASVASFALFTLCLIYAVSGSLGFVAMNRAKSTAVLASEGATARDIQAELDRKSAQLSALGLVEPSDVIAKSIEAIKQDRLYVASARCTDATIEKSRQFCAGLARLEGEQKKSEAAAKLESEIATFRDKRSALGGVVVVEKGDVQGSMIARLAGLNVETVQLMLTLLFVALVETGSCFLLWLSLNHVTGPALSKSVTPPATRGDDQDAVTSVQLHPAADSGCGSDIGPSLGQEQHRKSGALEEFIEQHLDIADDAEVDIAEIIKLYKLWCDDARLLALADEVIMERLETFRRIGGLKKSSRGGRVYLSGVRLKTSGLVRLGSTGIGQV